MLSELLGRIGRRFWARRVSLALNRAHEDGHLSSWLPHEIDARIKGYGGIPADKRYKAPETP